MVEPEPEQPMFTITFDGDGVCCNGPEMSPATTRIKGVLDVRDQDSWDEYGLVVVSIEEDKSSPIWKPGSAPDY